jgi:hypothetical protein
MSNTSWNTFSAFVKKAAVTANRPTSDPRPDLKQIQRDYQVVDEQMVDYKPKLTPWVDARRITATEKKMLDKLQFWKGLLGLQTFKDIADKALKVSSERYPAPKLLPSHVPLARANEWRGQDGHRDAFRHCYWNALLTKEFGANWTQQFTTAHEGVPGNPADREAMDLYNNEVGRKIALANPKASEEALATLVEQALNAGKLVVIAKEGGLQWSDRVALWNHGLSNEVPGTGGMQTPNGEARVGY